MGLPLNGVTVLEFCQFLSGPCAGLRLADLGARVIKIEKPKYGDSGRKLAIKDLWVNEDSLLFHTINRNKESVVVDFNNPVEKEFLSSLIEKADVIIQNFRPGVMEKNGLSYEDVEKINSSIIYTSISGYGNKGLWKEKPGQDLLIQSLSGLAFSTGNLNDNPIPFGLAIGDFLCGNQAVQAILAALIRKKKTGIGAKIDLSMMETLLDFQFEFFTTYFESKNLPTRSAVNNAHSLLSAPYGIYKTKNGFIAIAMMPLSKLNEAIDCKELLNFNESEVFILRDEIKLVLQKHFVSKSTEYWLMKGRQCDLWIAPVLNWKQLIETSTYKELKMEQKIKLGTEEITTTRCPISINGKYFLSNKRAPYLGEHTLLLKKELNLI
ncbi:CaiB/BaiF CoA-transferase family protein [Sphingobacterium sp.]|uniref:CaiB/BaiF CoA transferase family protein n=1 Tax=Sphingobacterium sp. TaxID=341027 RepID=UPI0028A9FF43|nr:CaiB/BaiF CoA-transferase family protein [Sphingobacterium sp.]